MGSGTPKPRPQDTIVAANNSPVTNVRHGQVCDWQLLMLSPSKSMRSVAMHHTLVQGSDTDVTY